MTHGRRPLITFREAQRGDLPQLGPNPLTPAETCCNSCRGVRRLEGAKLKAMLRAGRAAAQARAGTCQSTPEARDDGMAAGVRHFAVGWTASG